MANFENCIDYVLENEGGYVNHPSDSGGPTNMGITMATLLRWRAVREYPKKLVSLTEDDMKTLTVEEARQIYREQYWDAISLYNIDSDGVATAILDTAVLRGQTKSIMYAQKTCNAFLPITSNKDNWKKPDGLEVNGRVTTMLIERINNLNEGLWINQFADFLKKAYIQITMDHPDKKVFLPGWLNRNAKLLTLIKEEF